MCKLTKEEFLNTRFIENNIEFDVLSQINTEGEDNGVYTLIKAMRDIAKRKRDFYKKSLEEELINQEIKYDDDLLLSELKNLKLKRDSGELDNREYWIKVDRVLADGEKKKRKYMQLNDTWVRIDN